MNRRPVILDLFCCGGGAGMGYRQAGFDIVGVDIEEQQNYPGQFIRDDAISFLEKHGAEFCAIHASPPCQAYSSHVSSRSSKWNRTLGKDEPMLIDRVRSLLCRTGRPWVLENVIGARHSMGASLLLCGTMFGLPISRHRIFESSEWIAQPEHPRCSGVAKRFAEARGWEYRDMSVTGKGRRKGTTDRWKEVMQIHWPMTQHQLAEAIPPAFTRYIGQQLIGLIELKEKSGGRAAGVVPRERA